MTKPKMDMERFLESAFRGPVTGDKSGVRTWTYEPAGPSFEITIPPRKGVKLGAILLWDSLTGLLLRRGGVTISYAEEPPELPPFTIEWGD